MAQRALGFDTSQYPGDSKMLVWRAESPYVFTGYYLKSPCHSNPSWSGKRQTLAEMAWGFAVIYVGRQIQGPCSSMPVSRDIGAAHGQDAVAQCRAEGFPPLAVVFLDVEVMDIIPARMNDYVNAWFLVLRRSPFVAGMYCHVRNAAALKAAALRNYPAGGRDPVFWVAGGRNFHPETSFPADSGVPFARLWQGRLQTDETHGGVLIPIDIDVADSPDPSGVYVPPAAPPDAPVS